MSQQLLEFYKSLSVNKKKYDSKIKKYLEKFERDRNNFFEKYGLMFIEEPLLFKRKLKIRKNNKKNVKIFTQIINHETAGDILLSKKYLVKTGIFEKCDKQSLFNTKIFDEYYSTCKFINFNYFE